MYMIFIKLNYFDVNGKFFLSSLSYTWDLLRVVVHGFLLFPEWFFTCVCSDGSYFISPLRINGSAVTVNF